MGAFFHLGDTRYKTCNKAVILNLILVLRQHIFKMFIRFDCGFFYISVTIKVRSDDTYK